MCGLFAPPNHMRRITDHFVEGYEHCYDKVYDRKLQYMPHSVCEYCYRSMTAFSSGHQEKHRSKYVSPVKWLPLSEHIGELCYFCQTVTTGFRYETRERVHYANVPSVIPARLYSGAQTEYGVNDEDEAMAELPVEHAEEMLEIEAVAPMQQSQASTSSGLGAQTSISSRVGASARTMTDASDRTHTTTRTGTTTSYISDVTSIAPSEYLPNISVIDEPHFITQSDFDDLVRESNMSKRSAEIWASRLKQWKLVVPDFRITSGRKRANYSNFNEYFALDDYSKIAYCTDVDGLFEAFGQPHNPDNWRLFIDSSVESLKVVLLHIGNKFASVPIAYGRNVPENYETMKSILTLINYNVHEWRICCDLKVVSLLTGVKKGFSKHQCFLCTWEGRRRDLHYTGFNWPPRITYQLGRDSIDHMPLVRASKVILPPLHIKLGLIRNFVRALVSNVDAFNHLKTIFPRLSAAKIDAGISIS